VQQLVLNYLVFVSSASDMEDKWNFKQSPDTGNSRQLIQNGLATPSWVEEHCFTEMKKSNSSLYSRPSCDCTAKKTPVCTQYT